MRVLYVDFFDLLNRNVEKRYLDKEDEKDKERHRRKKPGRTFLFKYLDIIYTSYVDFTGQAWLAYNKSFHMRSVIQPNL